MLKSILKTSIFIACLAGSGFANAAGLGGINVTSALGQPLKAEIDVVSVDKADKATLRAKLASPDDYKDAGVDYPYNVPKLKFQLEERANGDQYVKVTSLQPVNEPFVTLMVELSWASGKLLREYTFLLDPVGYKPEQPKPENLEPIQPVLAEPAVTTEMPELAASAPAVAEPKAEQAPAEAVAATPAAPVAASEVAAAPAAEAAVPAPASAVAETTAPAGNAAPVEEALTPESAPVAAAPVEVKPMEDALSKEEALAAAAPVSAPAAADQIVVVRGDTLAKIAAQIKPPDVSLERMLVSLYRENAAVFDGHNMNRIRAGKILNIPSNEAIQALPQADAVEEIHAQAADWNVYRQKLAAARAARAEREAKQEAAGKITTAVSDNAAAKKAPAKEVLKLSKGEAPNDKAVGGGKSTTQEQVIAKEEDAIAGNKALKESQERTAILEKNVQDMKHLAELKSQAVQASAPAAAAVAVEPASAPQAASSVAPAETKPKIKPRIVMPKVVEQPSLIDEILGEPLYLAGGAAVLLALGGLGFMVARRGKQGGKPKKSSKKKDKEDDGSTTGRMAAPVAPSPDTGDFTQAAVQSTSAASSDSEEVDPIGEADLFLTFGRDAQAEEVLKEALKKNPNNIPVKLKLLSIYVSRKDTNAFYSYAREIKESGDQSAWEQTASMGRELDPTNPFYGGNAGAAPAAANRPEPSSGAAPAVDFDLGFGSSAPAPVNQKTVVLETTPSQEKTTIIAPEELHSAALASTMDFDITGTNPGTPSPATGKQESTMSMNMEDLVFDVTATHPKIPAQVNAAPAAVGDSSLAFTLDFPIEDKSAAPAPARNLGLDEITLNLDKTGTSPVTGNTGQKDEHWQEVATKLDLAKAYQEMGDAAGAREILEEVLRDGDEEQRGTAQTLMQQL